MGDGAWPIFDSKEREKVGDEVSQLGGDCIKASGFVSRFGVASREGKQL